MLDDSSFIAEIRANPRDLTPRLIYADYLEETGDARGEFIRVQCELAETSHGAPARSRLFQREKELLDQYGQAWLQPLKSLGAQGLGLRSFRCGLIERVSLAAQHLEQLEALCELAPGLICLDMRAVGESRDSLSRLELPPQIQELELHANQLGEAEADALVDSGVPEQLVNLKLSFNRLEQAGFAQLSARSWPKLRSLDISHNAISGSALRSLTAHTFPKLTRLLMAGNEISGQGFVDFQQSAVAEQMRELDFSSNSIGGSSAAPFHNARFQVLQTLLVRNNGLRAPEILAILDEPWVANLKRLDLRNNVSLDGELARFPQSCRVLI